MLIHLSRYTATPLTSTFIHYIDNKSVIGRKRTEDKRSYHIPNKTLSPDWDVIQALSATTRALPRSQTKWIRGHQDADKPRETLSHAAQLNCEADDEAGDYQDNFGEERLIAPMLPNTHAHLVIDGATINSYYKTRIREAATLPPYFKYLENKFDWTTDTRKTIDWGSYKQIIRKFRDRHTTLVKHIHEIAPSGIIAHRNNHHYSLKCPSCEIHDETNNHLLQCPANSRATWRTTVLRKLRTTTTDQYNDPTLADILRDGITRWLRQLPPIEAHQYPNEYHSLIRSQDDIGWSHLFRGRWSLQWRLCHERYALRSNLSTKYSDGQRWVRKLGVVLLTQWFDLWKLRNLERHGKDVAEQASKRRTFLQSQLEELYSYHDAMLPLHRHILLADAATHMAQRPNLDGLETWIHTFGPAIHSSVKQATARRVAQLAGPQPNQPNG
jgi:hypothetical protein